MRNFKLDTGTVELSALQRIIMRQEEEIKELKSNLAGESERVKEERIRERKHIHILGIQKSKDQVEILQNLFVCCIAIVAILGILATLAYVTFIGVYSPEDAEDVAESIFLHCPTKELDAHDSAVIRERCINLVSDYIIYQQFKQEGKNESNPAEPLGL